MNIQGLRVLVTGSRGMLAGELLPLLSSRGAEVYASDIRPSATDAIKIHELDITQSGAVLETLEKFRPAVIINCAAFTAVDDAESNLQAALAVNTLGPGTLALGAKQVSAKLLHISTDYVFGRLIGVRLPIAESQAPAACGVYGHSKLAGEELVKELLPNAHLIVRTSWLHGKRGPNFLETILRAGRERPELKVVNDQFGSPTWAGWLAEILLKLVEKDATGVFHACSRGDITWFDFAKEILSQAGVATPVLPQSTAELNRPAPRPPYSTLSVEKLEKFLGVQAPSWKEGVRSHLLSLGQQ